MFNKKRKHYKRVHLAEVKDLQTQIRKRKELPYAVDNLQFY